MVKCLRRYFHKVLRSISNQKLLVFLSYHLRIYKNLKIVCSYVQKKLYATYSLYFLRCRKKSKHYYDNASNFYIKSR